MKYIRKNKTTQHNFFFLQKNFIYGKISDKIKKKYEHFSYLADYIPTLDADIREFLDNMLFILKNQATKNKIVYIMKHFLSEGTYAYTKEAEQRHDGNLGTFIKSVDALRGAIYKQHPETRQHKLHKSSFKRACDWLSTMGVMDFELKYDSKKKKQYKSYHLKEKFLIPHLTLHKMGVWNGNSANEIISNIEAVSNMYSNEQTLKQYIAKFISTTFCTKFVTEPLINAYHSLLQLPENSSIKTLFKDQLAFFTGHSNPQTARIQTGVLPAENHPSASAVNKLSTDSNPQTARIPQSTNRPYISNIYINSTYTKNKKDNYVYKCNSHVRARDTPPSGVGGKPRIQLSEYHTHILNELIDSLCENKDTMETILECSKKLNKKVAYAKSQNVKIRNPSKFMLGALRSELSMPWHKHRMATKEAV